jgi:hypothetical protein
MRFNASVSHERGRVDRYFAPPREPVHGVARRLLPVVVGAVERQRDVLSHGRRERRLFEPGELGIDRLEKRFVGASQRA